MEAMDEIAEDLEDATRRHNSKILCWHVKKMRGNSNSGFVPFKDRKWASISYEESVKERGAKHYENVLNLDKGAGNGIKKNGKFCDNL